MAVCENYRCIQKRRECKKLFQGWSKQVLTLVGMEAVLEGFVGEEVTSYLIQNPRVNSPRDFDSNEKFCFYDNDHETVIDSVIKTAEGCATSAIASDAPNATCVSNFNEDTCLLGTSTIDDDSRLLLNISNLGSTGGPVCFGVRDETTNSVSMKTSDRIEEEAGGLSNHVRNVMDATSIFTALHHQQSQAAAAMAASHYLSQRANASSQLLSSSRPSKEASQITQNVEDKAEDVKVVPQDEPLDLTIRTPKTVSHKNALNGSQDIQSHTTSKSISAFNLLNGSPSIPTSTSTTRILQHLKQETSSSNDLNKTDSTSVGGKSVSSSPHRNHHSNNHHYHSNHSGAPVRKTYTEAELTKAVRAILHGKLGTRRASAEFGIPRSTLRNKICKLNEMKRKEEENTGRRIEMEDFLESVINTPIFQVNCRREITPAKLLTNARLPNSGSSSLLDSPTTTYKKNCLSNGTVDKQVPSPANSTPSSIGGGGGSSVKPSTAVTAVSEVSVASAPTTPPPNSSASSNALSNAFTCPASQQQFEMQQKMQNDDLYSQQWTQSNIVSSMVEVAKRCLAMSEDEKTTYLDQQYRKYGHAYTASFVHYIPWFMVSMFSNPTIMENFGGALNGSSFSSSASAAAAVASVPNAASFSLLDGFLNQCAASALAAFPETAIDHSTATSTLVDRSHQDLTLGRPSPQVTTNLHTSDARTTNNSSSSTEPASSVVMETGSGGIEETASCDSWSTTPSDPCDGERSDSTNERPKTCRAKRGNYRRYNTATLMEAVEAVTKGLMTVHKAGNHFGIPHSTLEYKVKERFLRQRKQEVDEDDDGLSSPAESTSGGTNPPLGAGGVVFPGMDAGEEDDDGDDTEEEEVPVPVAMETENEDDGGGCSGDDTVTREVSLADRSPSLSPPLSDSC